MIIVDTGPIVALLNRRDAFHTWARDLFAHSKPPHTTCDAVLTEACHLLGRSGADAVMALGERGFLSATFQVESEWLKLRALMKRYVNVPMSFADACLVRMSELDPGARIATLDGDFHVYRRNGRQVIATIMPR